MPSRTTRGRRRTAADIIDFWKDERYGTGKSENLSNQFDVEEDSITPETNIADDLGADSLDVVDMLMSLEDEFDVEIPDDEIEKIRTVGDLVTYIEENM